MGNHGRRKRGPGGTCPHISKTRLKCPSSCNLAAFLEDFENVTMNRKIHVSGDFRGSKFQNFPGEHASDPPSGCFL